MRNIEELYETSNEDLPELYCDLDQVLVDFLKGAEKVVGQPFAKSDTIFLSLVNRFIAKNAPPTIPAW